MWQWTFLQYNEAIKNNQEFSLESCLGVHAITDNEKQEETELEEVYCTEQQKKVLGGGNRCSRQSQLWICSTVTTGLNSQQCKVIAPIPINTALLSGFQQQQKTSYFLKKHVAHTLAYHVDEL